MAIRQYIGARYIPRFLGTYDPTTSYEALDVVDNGAGTSYIARKTVPVNTPLNNTTYWAVYGASSGAIIDLQNRMNAAETAIDSMPVKKKYVLIGDSFGVGIRGGGQTWVTGWLYYMNAILPNRCFYYDPAGDQSFEGVSAFTSISDKNFIGQLNYVYDNKLGTTAPEEITDVVVLGGTNEIVGATAASIASTIDTFCDRARYLFPNAEISIGCLGLNARSMMKRYVYDGYKLGAQRNGAAFLKQLFNLGTNKTYDSGSGHWSQAGYNYYNPIIAECIITGQTHYNWYQTYNLTMSSDVNVGTATINFDLEIRVNEKGVFVRCFDAARGKGWPIKNNKAYSGSGTFTVEPFTFTGQVYTAILNDVAIDNTIVMYNSNNNKFDGAPAKLMVRFDLNSNPTTHELRIQSVPSSIYDNAQQIAWSWNGTVPTLVDIATAEP